MCGICDISNKLDDFDNPFNEHDINGFINGVWNKEITKRKLPTALYLKTAEHLNKGVFKGYGKDFISVDYDSPDLLMLQDLTDNIYIFSGAKTYQQVRQATDLLKTTKTFYEFQKEAKKQFSEFNDTYLRAEYNTAISSSSSAANWQRIVENSDVSPLLQYQTAGDGRVRPTHAALDNIIRPINDKFWSSYYPPNGWNCRCTTISIDESEGSITDLRGFKKPDDVPVEFMMNSGKDRIIFSDKHPYFKVAKDDKKFARDNFDMPIPNNKKDA